MTKVLLAAICVAPLALAGASAGTQDQDRSIRPGVGIGRINLGMPSAKARKLLGRETAINRNEPFGFGGRYIEYDYGYPGWTMAVVGHRVVVRHADGSETSFLLHSNLGDEPWDAPKPVIEVAVRSHARLAGERDWDCPSGWRAW